MFTQGQQGAWYDPADLATLFEDSVGSDPVTADGDPVGLMLDKHLGLELGPELVTNGDFDTDTNWTKEAVWTIAGGVAQANGSTTGNIYQPGILTVGKWYKIKFDVAFGGNSGEALTLRFSPNGNNVWARTFTEGNGTIELNIEATNADLVLRAGWTGVGSFFNGTIDNVSVRELHGNHAAQNTTSMKPTYRTDGTLHRLEFDGDDDALVANIPGITNATVAIAKSTGTEITYPVDLSSGTFTMSETNYGIIVREGEFTEQEALDVTTYLNAKAGIS